MPVIPSLDPASPLLVDGADEMLLACLNSEFPDVTIEISDPTACVDLMGSWESRRESSARDFDDSEIHCAWKENMDKKSWAWVSADLQLASKNCIQSTISGITLSPNRGGREREDKLLGPPSDDDDDDVTGSRSLPIHPAAVTYKTAFSSTVITLSRAASELQSRWNEPDDFYGSVVPSSSSGIPRKRESMRKRKRQEHQKKMKDASDRNLDVLLSQASAVSSQQSAPMIYSSHDLSSGGIMVGSLDKKNVKKKPKKKAGF